MLNDSFQKQSRFKCLNQKTANFNTVSYVGHIFEFENLINYPVFIKIHKKRSLQAIKSL